MQYTYKLSKEILGTQTILRSDGTCIPKDEQNADYQKYLKWIDGYELQFTDSPFGPEYVKTSNGNTPLPADE